MAPVDEFRLLSTPSHVELRCRRFSVIVCKPEILRRAWRVNRMVDEFVDAPAVDPPALPALDLGRLDDDPLFRDLVAADRRSTRLAAPISRRAAEDSRRVRPADASVGRPVGGPVVARMSVARRVGAVASGEGGEVSRSGAAQPRRRPECIRSSIDDVIDVA